ncbi:hypothetical protein EF888_15230 [Silicimonas algicola]|nr:hypothetical protein [Silicimonas algicola]AZQ68362.1 hypothetical protein EF888_15230 [Silicimonas algicola]
MLLFRPFAIFLFLSAQAMAGGIAWPDPRIPVPDDVRVFVHSECEAFRGWSEETVDECITGELYGYRAVVMMLMDEELGETTAERYRGCAAGLGGLGGRLHRRKAECISAVHCIVWRFSFSRETALQDTRRADWSLPVSKSERQKAYETAMAVLRRG